MFVTHDQDEALAIADRVAVIFAGRVAQIAPPAELYERPRTAQVADFVGLSNRIRGEAKGGTAAVLDARLPLLEGSATDGPVTVLVRPEMVELTAGSRRAPTGSSRRASWARSRASRCASPTARSCSRRCRAPRSARFRQGDAVRVGLKPTPALAVEA